MSQDAAVLDPPTIFVFGRLFYHTFKIFSKEKDLMKFCLTMLALFALTSSAQATGINYGFDGVVNDHFTPLFPNAVGSMTQNDVAEQAEYSAPDGNLSGENGTGFQHLNFRPRYDQSWSVAIDVTVPASYDTSFLTNNPDNLDPNGDTWLEAGLAAYTDFNASKVFSGALAIALDGNGSRNRHFSAFEDLSSTDLRLPTTETTSRIRLDFDANSKEISAYAGNSLLLSIDLSDGASDWELADSDRFSIAFFGAAGYQEVTAADPLVFDNFSATIVPEPSTAILSWFALTALALRRRRNL